ncbi:C39 family peptidase [Candidatus Enterococcus murrayae]|nr:C39 family peptidase [Enterococcus sp. MJM16]
MEKKRYKMYKKGKIWVVAPIVFLGVVGLASDKTVVHADETEAAQVQQVSEELQPSSSDPAVELKTTEAVEENEPDSNVADNADAKNGEQSTEAVTEESQTEATVETQRPETTTSSESAATTSKEKVDVQASTPAEKQTTASSTKATTQSSAAARASVTAKAAKIAIYRVYNPNSGEHLHTMNAGERDYLVRLGWRNEGISMYVDGTGNQLYRLYNPNSGEHFYTLNAKERDNLKKHGWRYEGIAWKTPKTGQAMYRVFNPNARGAGSHHYTMLVSERNDLVKRGWRNEGIAWYTAGGSQTVASYILLNAPFINQYSAGFPMGCEAASLLQALQQKGYAKNYNLKSFIKEMPMSPNNNPNNGFSGKPDKVVSNIYHSIYAKPLANWGNKYAKAADISGVSVETLKDELRKGNPVVVYVTGDYAAPRYGKYWWGTGIDNAHVVTLDGFNQNNNTYHISDPAKGKYWVSASKFEASYNLRKSAVVVR